MMIVVNLRLAYEFCWVKIHLLLWQINCHHDKPFHDCSVAPRISCKYDLIVLQVSANNSCILSKLSPWWNHQSYDIFSTDPNHVSTFELFFCFFWVFGCFGYHSITCTVILVHCNDTFVINEVFLLIKRIYLFFFFEFKFHHFFTYLMFSSPSFWCWLCLINRVSFTLLKHDAYTHLWNHNLPYLPTWPYLP